MIMILGWPATRVAKEAIFARFERHSAKPKTVGFTGLDSASSAG
jgi:hypothetical protein